MPDIECPVLHAALMFKDLPALITDNKIITYNECDRLVASATARLQDCGVIAGERVAIISANTLEYPILLMALFRVRAVACPISPRVPERSILEYLKKIKCGRVLDLSNRPPTDKSLRFQKLAAGELVDSTGTGKAPPGDPPISLEQDATIISTSGTSGQPKAVLHSYGNHYYSAVGSNKNIRVRPGDRWLLSLPLYHVGGLAILFRTIHGGGAVVFPNDNADLLQAIQKHHVTHLSFVLTQLYRLLQKPSFAEEIKQLKAVLAGGSVVPASLITKAYESGLPLFTTYGLTEMASQVATTRPGDSLDKLHTSGKPLEHRQVKVSPEGEIMVKGATLFRGYVDRDDISLPRDSEGWFHTGDLGTIDSFGYLTVSGRKDNMFVSGGENIHPEEIEGTLSLLDSVSEAIVVPVDDDEFGFRPIAIVKTTGGIVNKSDLVTELEQFLPRFKIPVRFYQWPETTRENQLKPARHYFLELSRRGGLTELT